MNIIINQSKLLSALKTVERIVVKNASLPILNTTLLKTISGRLKISATSLEMGINYWVGAKIIEEGEICVPVRIFSDFIGNISDEKITITNNKNTIIINSEHYKTQILSMETKDFPIIPKVKKDASFKINGQLLKLALASVLDSASLSETRPELSGIYVNITDDRAEFAATDSFRLSEKIIGLKGDIKKSFIIPRNAAIEIMRIAENLNEDVSVSISENQIFVFGDDFEFISRLVDGRYPEYKKVIPERFISLARVNKFDLEKNVRLASIFSSSISDIKLKVEKNVMEIYARNSDKGEIVSNIPCHIKNSPFEVSVNYHYLLDGLKIIPANNVILEFTGEGSPVVLKGEDNTDQTYVIMPLRG